MLETSYP